MLGLGAADRLASALENSFPAAIQTPRVPSPPVYSLAARHDGPVLRGPAPLRYVRDPAEIYRLSFEAVRAEARLDHLPRDLAEVAVRLVHACGMPEITARLAWSEGVAEAARQALVAGAAVLCDCQAVASMVIRDRLPAGNAVVCTLGAPEVPALAREIGNTRSAAAVELWRDRVEGAVVVIGNAPTALYHLLELLDSGWPRPATILAFPVGFVGAAESKAELAARPRGVPFLTLRGRRGGSALAAAAVNALAAGEP
jgi:precorrin-8X/cobalt-precorrin-8 methylmutase